MTSLFCRGCGAKLDHSNIKAAEFIRPGKPGIGILRRLLAVVRLVVVLAIIVVAGLAFWPTYPTGGAGSVAMAREFRDKLERLHEAVENKTGMQVVVLESEINAYLSALVDQHQEEAPSGGLSVVLEELNVALDKELDEESALLFVRSKLGPVPIVYTLSGTPVVGEEGFSLAVKEAYLGHLPLPGALHGFVEGKVMPIFEDLKAERFVLDGLARIELANARARLTTQPSRPAYDPGTITNKANAGATRPPR